MSPSWSWIYRMRIVPRHPSFRQLVDWHEGEIEDRFLVWTTKHVLACPRCRWETGVIRLVIGRGSTTLEEPDAAPAHDHEVDRLSSLMQDETVLAAMRQRLRANSDLQLVSRLWPYLGQYPLSLLERSVTGGLPFDAEVAHVTEVLLGRKAAAVLLASRRLETEAA